jgi:hypothetical protein
MERMARAELKRKLLATLKGVGEHAAELIVTRDADEAFEARLEPRNRSASPVHIDVDAQSDVIFLSIGVHSVYEVDAGPKGWRQLKRMSPTDEVVAVVDAVIRGAFHEKLWFRAGSVVASQATLQIDGERIWVERATDSKRSAVVEERQYEPYV